MAGSSSSGAQTSLPLSGHSAFDRLSERSYWPWLIGVLLLGSALRLLFWWQQSRSGVVPPFGDEEEYYRGAIHILKELRYYDRGQWLRAPFPSFVLALCFLVVGVNIPLALGLQALLSGLAVLPVADTARRYFGSRLAGLVAGLLTAIYVPYAISASQLMSEPMAILTIALAIWCLERWRTSEKGGWLFLGGVALSSFTLTRAMGLYAQVLVLGWIWWQFRSLLRALKGMVIFLLGFWVVLMPWSIRNTLAFGQIVLVDTNTGFSFWSGTSEPEDRLQLQIYWNTTITNPAEREDREYARAIENIRRDPGAWLAAAPSKVTSLWQLRVRSLIANTVRSLSPTTTSVSVTMIGDLLYVVAALGSLISLVYVRPSKAHLFLLLWPVYGTLLATFSMGHPRLRIPLEITLLILSAYPLAHPRCMWQTIRRRGARRCLALGGAVAGLALLIFSSVYPAFVRSQGHLGVAWFWWAVGNRSRSLAETRAAVAAEPGTAIPLLVLAQRQQQMGHPERIATWQQVLQIDKSIVPAQAELLREAIQNEDAAAIQEQLAAIRAICYDDNRLYRWLWAQNVGHARTSLQIGAIEDLGLIDGVSSPQEEDGVSFRWTQAEARLRMAAGPPTTLLLRLRGWYPGAVRVSVNGRSVAVCEVDQAWSDCTAVLAFAEEPRIVTIRSAVDVPWPPGDYVPRGVALTRAWYEPE